MILGGPEIVVGQIEKIEGNDFLVQGNDGQYMKLQLTKDTNKILEARVPGTGKDNGPNCATVKPFAGWHISNRSVKKNRSYQFQKVGRKGSDQFIIPLPHF